MRLSHFNVDFPLFWIACLNSGLCRLSSLLKVRFHHHHRLPLLAIVPRFILLYKALLPLRYLRFHKERLLLADPNFRFGLIVILLYAILELDTVMRLSKATSLLQSRVEVLNSFQALLLRILLILRYAV